MKKVIIASKNPVKINATKLAFEQMFPEQIFEFDGLNVPSNVGDQPSTDSETLDGAKNRSNNIKIKCPNADYWVGIEGGIEKKDHQTEVFAWMFIQSSIIESKSRTATFNLPKVSMVFSIADLTSPSLVTSVLQKIAEVPNSLTNSLPRIESISKIATLPPPEIIALTVVTIA